VKLRIFVLQGGARTEAGDATAVYVGIQQMEYGSLAAEHIPDMGAFAATGSPFSVAAGRLSFTYGFKGPSVSFLSFTH
jgi:acyl transferase domain-containing protein